MADSQAQAWTDTEALIGGDGAEDEKKSPNRSNRLSRLTASTWTSRLTDSHDEVISLPQSTHTFLFTEEIRSTPFAFALVVAAITISCLALALNDNLSGGTPGNPLYVPANVMGTVRTAHFFSIIITVLMEEEIPTGLHLLGGLPRCSVRDFGIADDYWRFVGSALCRLVIGYLFLFNAFLVIVQAERVLDMFYDMLALQFVSMIDDISFRLAQLDVLGKDLRNATASEMKMTLFVKTLFSVNFLLLFAGVATVGFCQEMGNLFAGSITVAFPEEVWKEALTKTPDGFQRRFLIYSSFNGVYKKVEGMTHGGRPMYRELKKSSGTEEFTRHVPAEIKYCEKEGFWAFTHKDIQKSESETESTQCNWLLRSPETQAFDLMDVSRDWSVWVGVIKDGINVNLKVNGCKGDADCNLNGVCKDEKCVCDPNGTHYGLHCELDIPCHRIIREDDNTTWTARRSHTSDCKDSDDFVYQYMRPIYTSDNYGSSHVKSDRLNFVYAGSRWRAMRVHGIENKTSEEQVDFGSDFHSFWDLSCNFSAPTLLVSDPTSRSMPVGVDFYMTGSEEGDQYGPFGVLHPIQDPPGNYPFRCDHSFTKASAIAACRNQSST